MKSKEKLISNKNQEIRMVIKGTGSKRILADKFPYNNFEVLVNGETNNFCNRICNNIIDELNYIIIKFNETIKS